MGALRYQNKRRWILLNMFLCLPEPPVELFSGDLEWKGESLTGELWDALREAGQLQNALE